MTVRDLSGIKLSGRYEIEQLLGAGGFGAVWAARDRLHGMADRRVAVKTLLHLTKKADLDQFLRESESLAKLSEHPAITTIYEFGVHDPQNLMIPFLVLEFIDGGSVEDLLGSSRVLPVANVLPIAHQVLDALDTAHSKGILHRDVKPGNIMVDSKGYVRLSDFGLAFNAYEKDLTASIGIGSLVFMPPEQILGHGLSAATDLYALGGTLYYMLTGELAMPPAETQPQCIRHIFEAPPRWIADVAPQANVHPAIELVLRSALEKQPGDRYQSARQFKEALDVAAAKGLYMAPSGEVEVPEMTRAGLVLDPSVDREELLQKFLSGDNRNLAEDLATAGDDGEKRVSIMLEHARQKLLDFGLRANPLLNYNKPRGKNGGFAIVDELPAEVLRILVQEGRTMSFDAATDSADGDFAQPAEDGGIADRHLDAKLQTALDSTELQTRLTRTAAQAQTLIEDLGVNTLYLALGMLRWAEDDKKKGLRAPLVLVPVSLDRTEARSRFRIRWTGDEIGFNLNLVERLKKMGISAPTFDDPEQLDLREYFAAYETAIRAKITDPDWRVEHDAIVLGFFSFGKFLMYKDLDPANWPDRLSPNEQSNVLARLLTGRLSEDIATGTRGEAETAAADLPSQQLNKLAGLNVVDADGSQNAVVNDIVEGKDIVVQGPPGTGKSQTIANVIADAVRRGKRVLFVAEKLAALEVVFRRLDNIGLGDACLELHSNKMSKTTFIKQLHEAAQLGQPTELDVSQGEAALHAAERQLTEYVSAMNDAIGASGVSPYEAIGILLMIASQHQDEIIPDLNIEGWEQWTLDDAQERFGAIDSLVQLALRIGTPSEHPFWGAQITELHGAAQRKIMVLLGLLWVRSGRNSGCEQGRSTILGVL